MASEENDERYDEEADPEEDGDAEGGDGEDANQPFSEEEWERVTEAGFAILKASEREDREEYETCMRDLEAVISELTEKYGEHPILLETRADFADVASERVRLYVRARDLAVQAGLTTLSIRLALARVLLEDFDDPKRALDELTAGMSELDDAEDYEREEHGELLELVRSKASGSAPEDAE